MSLYEYAAENNTVYNVLTNRYLNHQQVADTLNLIPEVSTSRTSVRRARAKLGVLSPLSPRAKEYDYVPHTVNVSDEVVASETPSLLTRLKGLFRFGRS